ncbi:hypothetical protein MNBD_IGNAVI01-1119 [hydrothermal vent metagenome]|uniref:Lipoprotein n=1 Tax=hydrothermal vent metagenome TaxID=652676 RepID=A0A3B1CRG2_9ZZZZ
MKNQIFGLLFILFIFVSCKENAPTKPEEIIDDAIATETIGASGGTLETKEFKLEIPPGAFRTGAELKLYVEDKNEADENSVTKSYQLKGLPTEFTKSLKIGLKYNSTLINESFILFKQKFLFGETGDTLNISNLTQAYDSSGFLWSQLSLRSGNALSKVNSNKLFVDFTEFFGVSNFTTKTSAHFSLSLPSEISSKATLLLGFLENNYNKIINNVRLSFDNKWWEWPIKVTTIDVKSNSYFIYLARNYQTRQSFKAANILTQFQIDKNLLNQTDFNKTIVELGKDAVNFAMSIYFESSQDSWVRRAIYTWSEELFTENQNFVSPESFLKNSKLPLDVGVAQKEGAILNLEHGDGMSSLIKYLVDDETKFGKEGLKNTLESIQTGTNPVTALIKNVKALKTEWLTDYFQKYIGGKIYKVPASVFVDFQSLTGVWDIQNDADTLMEFKPTNAGVGKMPSLSAQLFLVNLKYPDIDPSKSLTVGVEGDINSDGFSTIIFGYKNGLLENLVQGYASESILEIPNLKNSGYTQFLIVVVNSNGVQPYDGEFNAYLTLKVEGNDNGGSNNILASNMCSISVVVNGRFRQGDGSEFDGKRDITGDAFSVKGSFSGNTFTGNYSNADPIYYETYEGALKITLNDSHSIVTSFKWTHNGKSYSGDFTRFDVGASNIPVGDPLVYYSDAYRIFRIEGVQTCNSLSSVEYQDYGRWFYDAESTLLSYTCDQESYIHIAFRQE